MLRAASKHDSDPYSKHLLSSYYVRGPGDTVGNQRDFTQSSKSLWSRQMNIQPQLRMKPINTGWGEGAEERRLRGLHRGSHAPFFIQKQHRGPGRALCSKVTQPASRRLKFKVSNSSPGTVLLPWGEATNTCSRHSTGFSRAR